MKTFISAIVIFSAFIVAGCGKSVEITEYPTFYSPALKHVAVLPFRNDAYHYGAGQKIAGDFARSLSNNGTYDVLNMADQPQVVGVPSSEQFKTAIRRLHAQGIQAVFVGKVTDYRFNEYISYDPDFDGCDDGYYDPAFVNQQITYTANVGVMVSMLDTKTGKVINATPLPVTAESENFISGFFSESEISKQRLFSNATDRAVEKLLKQFCVTQQTIHLHGKSFVTGKLENDGVFKKSSKLISANDSAIVLTLPVECSLNTFTVTVKQTEPATRTLLTETIIWQRGQIKKLFQLGKLTPGKYRADLIHTDKTIFSHKFEVK